MSHLNVTGLSYDSLPSKVKAFVQQWADLCEPKDLHICVGGKEEAQEFRDKLVEMGVARRLPKYKNCISVRTCPNDVARVESRTFICTPEQREAVCIPKPGVTTKLGNWCNDVEMREKLLKLCKGSMKGRTVYLIIYCMGPLGSELAKIGVQFSDSLYVAAAMSIMTIVGKEVLKHLDEDAFIKCVHTVCCPLPLPEGSPEYLKTWPCNPENTYITQFPHTNEIISVGSGYGGNSILGKKCFALRIASSLAKREGWLAEHMLILGITNPQGEKKYIAAAFPSACGKTNLALMTPTLPGWKVECIGDDIAWMRFNENGELRAVNPEKGFFGVAPGTSHKTNAVAMDCIKEDTVFTNVAETSDGGVFWEGLEDEVDLNSVKITDWHGNPWTPGSGTKAAHPNSRFCSPIENCPILDPKYYDPRGVPISALMFGGRRPKGIPLIYESLDWEHGVLVAASLRSETTAAAADVTAKVVRCDPSAMSPFFGINAGDYYQHWLDVARVPGRQLPKIYHVNWFKTDEDGKFMWPGFGENCRVIKWIFERCSGTVDAKTTPIGRVPFAKDFDLSGLEGVNLENLLEVDNSFFTQELEEIKTYLTNTINEDFPKELYDCLNSVQQSLKA